MKNHKIPLYAQLIGLAFFVALLLGTIVFFVTVFDASPYKPPVVLNRNYDRSAMQASLATNVVHDTYEQIIGFGSRAPGQEGLEKTAALIEKAYADAGLDCFTQDVDVPYPLTQKGSGHLTLKDGKELPVWPFCPNYAQPVTTGAKGIDGTLFLATEENIRKEMDFSDKIAVLDISLPVFADLGYNPAQYTELGFKGVIITSETPLEEIPWKQLSGMFLPNLPVNIVRLLAEKDILDHIGEDVHIDARSSWVNARTRNIVGVLHAKNPTKDALVIPVTYDSTSLVPDVSRGSTLALQTAVQLQLLKGILPHRDALKRDVIFVATTGSSQMQLGISRLLSTIGNYGKADYMRIRIENDLADNEKHIEMLKKIQSCFENPDFAVPEKTATTEAIIKALDQETRKFLAERVSAVLRRRVFEQSEVLLQANIAYRRNPDDLTTPEYHAFRVAKKHYDDLNNMSALPLARALERKVAKNPDFELADGSRGYIRDSLKSHIERLLAFHADKKTSLQKDLTLQKLFANYKAMLVISPRVEPSKKAVTHETIGYSSGSQIKVGGESCNLFGAMINDAIFALGLSGKVSVVAPTTTGFDNALGGLRLDTNPWAVIALPAFSILNPRNSAAPITTPTIQKHYDNLSSIANTLQVLGEVVISAGRGYGNFPRLPFKETYSLRGSVYAAGIGNSVVPNYAVENALIASNDLKPKFFTDPYGNYGAPFLTMPNFWERMAPPEAFYFNESGEIQYVKDYGSAAQFIYASRTMPISDIPVNLILYRATPVAVLNVINPQSMKAFTGIEFISRSGLSAFPSTCPYIRDPNAKMDFLPPAEYFFLTLKAGAPGNELVATTRAFCLGVTHTNDPSYKPTDNEIDGAGYLAADTPIFRNITSEAATSMDYLAAKRLKLQNRYGMADDMTLTFNDRAEELISENGEDVGKVPYLARLRNLRQGLSYLILNHPVIRESVSEAVWGILWYMGLLVPFIFFFEKLLFGFTDIRKQILAQGIIFLVIFSLLRILHPAFHMIRSSAMILLGFVIIIIVGSVTAVLSSKFQENLDALRKSQGAIKGVSGNKMGIIMTAFMLGLNNMHKRKVRTGLTCATLVLMTFVMISFTSVQSNVVEKEQAIGRAAYQGILVREKLFRPISSAEVDALNASYGEDHSVNVREMLIGHIDTLQNRTIVPDFKIVYGEGDKAAMKIAKGALLFNHTEPLASSIKLLTTNGWFTAEQAALNEGPYPVILPDTTAEQLGIFPDDVNKGEVHVTIGGTPYYVWGIFDAREFESVTDVDGQNLLPFDVEALTTPLSENRMVLAELTDPRLSASDVFLGLHGQTTIPDELGRRNASVVVDMGKSPYAVAKREITSYLEQTGRDTNYGLDGTAFNGRRARVRSMAGMADLLIPLIIAALTVLNTMKGSVYERHDEIFVYNAVGIAPRYIFFMFVAEALVYSVVGAVLGYILSQGIGRILTILNWTGGMNMNFTSITTIYASLAIAVATLASTYFPARSAMEIAKPTEDAGWTMPKPKDDDSIEFMLPFTFTPYDRIAVLAFFYNYFENHGEGSAGAFFSGIPELKIADHTDDLADGAYIPCLEVQVWLKPFDLGVSQRITIELATDPDTKEFISMMRLARVTGTRDAWLRLNGPLVKLIRQHFLHWRAVPAESKIEYFKQAKALMEQTVLHTEAEA